MRLGLAIALAAASASGTPFDPEDFIDSKGGWWMDWETNFSAGTWQPRKVATVTGNTFSEAGLSGGTVASVGSDGLDMDGVNDALVSTAASTVNTWMHETGVTIFYVCKLSGTAGTENLIDNAAIGNASQRGVQVVHSAAGALETLAIRACNGSGTHMVNLGYDIDAAGLDEEQMHCYVASWNPTSRIALLGADHLMPEVQDVVGTPSASAPYGVLCIGCWNITNGYGLTGSIADVFVVQGVLTAAEIEQVTTYLLSKNSIASAGSTWADYITAGAEIVL